MKIVINASNLRVGGAIQVALSVINELYSHPEHEFHVFLSPAFNGIIEASIFNQKNIYVYFVDYPSRFTFKGRVKKLDSLEESINPDIVFSIFGPSYWNPKSPHMAGFAQGYYLYTELPYFKEITFISKVKWALLSYYHKVLLQRHVQHFVVETNDVKDRLCRFLKINKDSVSVVTNTYSGYFSECSTSTSIVNKRKFNLLTVAYPYLHKNVTVFKEVSDILSSDEREYIFYITVPDDYYKSNFSGYEGKIINLGLVKNSECPELYLKSDAMILPSLVECFSASYPEAMKMMRPILTSNYSFAQSICGDAAIYFNPLAPDDIAKKIRLLANDEKVYEELVLNGVKRLNCFLSPSERCNQYLYLMKNMVGNNV